MPRGSAPGERRGGKKVGSHNKATLARIEQEKIDEQLAAKIGKEIGVPGSVAAAALEKARAGRKLAKEELEEVVPIVKGIVAHHQRKVMVAGEGGALTIKDGADLGDLKEWLRLFVDTCFKLADFQSPKFKAIIVSAQGGMGDAPAPKNPTNVHQINDPIAAARVYRRVVTGGTRR